MSAPKLVYMTPSDLELLCSSIFGRVNWPDRVATQLNVDVKTLYRWRKGQTPIPHWVPLLLNALGTLTLNDLPLPEPVAAFDPTTIQDEPPLRNRAGTTYDTSVDWLDERPSKGWYFSAKPSPLKNR